MKQMQCTFAFQYAKTTGHISGFGIDGLPGSMGLPGAITYGKRKN